MFNVSCPKCSKKLKATPEHVGKLVRCKCGHTFVMNSVVPVPFGAARERRQDAESLRQEAAKDAQSAREGRGRRIAASKPATISLPRWLVVSAAVGLILAVPIFLAAGYLVIRSISSPKAEAAPAATAVAPASPTVAPAASTVAPAAPTVAPPVAAVVEKPAQPEPRAAIRSAQDILAAAPESRMTLDEFFQYKAAFVRNTGDGRPFTEHRGKRVTWYCGVDEAAISANGKAFLVFGHSEEAERFKLRGDDIKQAEKLKQEIAAAEKKSKELEAAWKKLSDDKDAPYDKTTAANEAYNASLDAVIAVRNRVNELNERELAFSSARNATAVVFVLSAKPDWDRIKQALDAAKKRPGGSVLAAIEGILDPGDEVNDMPRLVYCRLHRLLDVPENLK